MSWKSFWSFNWLCPGTDQCHDVVYLGRFTVSFHSHNSSHFSDPVDSPAATWLRLCNSLLLYSVSDLKLYEIQANRACNFIKFQAHLESSRPHKSLCQQSCCQCIWNSTFLTCGQPRNRKAPLESDNISHMVILNNLNNLIILRLAYEDTHFCSKDISYYEIFHHWFLP